MSSTLPTVVCRRFPSPTVTPQTLAWDGTQFWLSSRDLQLLYRTGAGPDRIVEEVRPPGGVWAGVATNDGLRFTVGEGAKDDRYVYRYTPDEGFTKLFACPEFTGSYLSFDGEHLYLSQWYNGRILKLNTKGGTLREIVVGAEICGHTIVDGVLYVLRGTEQNGESWRIARLPLGDENATPEDIAVVPFASRSLTFDGTRFWSNHRAANEIVSFSIS